MSSNRHVAVWMDHHEARIFDMDTVESEERTIRAPAHHARRHPKGPTAEHNHPDDLHRFFDAVARALRDAGRVLVLGPSTAKLLFIRHAQAQDATFEPRLAGVETVDHPSDRQIRAYATRYFVADDRRQGRHVSVP